jgi:hypothetical protein
MRAAVNLGEFEQLILLAILRLRDNAYGVTIARSWPIVPAAPSRRVRCTRRSSVSRPRD